MDSGRAVSGSVEITKPSRVHSMETPVFILCSAQGSPMHGTVSLPTWLAILLAALAAWAALDRLLLPGARWVLRRRVNRVLEELNTRLKIRIQPFKLTKREVLIDRLLYDPQVQQAAEAYAREGDMPRELAMRKVQAYAREIVPAFNAYAYFRFGYWLARNVARSLYRVRLGYSDEEGLAAIRRRRPSSSSSTTAPTWTTSSSRTSPRRRPRCPTRWASGRASGRCRPSMRAMGAYFVRRNSKDPLYRKVLERYVAMATAAGVTQAVFPEGGLSRDGRLRPPKLGILDYMLRSFDPAGGPRHRLRAGRDQLRPHLRGPQLFWSIRDALGEDRRDRGHRRASSGAISGSRRATSGTASATPA